MRMRFYDLYFPMFMPFFYRDLKDDDIPESLRRDIFPDGTVPTPQNRPEHEKW